MCRRLDEGEGKRWRKERDDADEISISLQYSSSKLDERYGRMTCLIDEGERGERP